MTARCSADGSARSTSRRTNSWLGSARYVHRNPLVFVSIESLAAYRWSSYGVYLGRRRPPPWLTLGRGHRGRSAGDAEAHRAFVETPQPSDELDAGALAMLGHHVSLDRLLEVVAAVAGVDVGSITSTAPGRFNAARTVALMLATELRLASATDLADRFDLATASSVRTIARRGRVAATDDQRIVVAARTRARRAVRPARPVAKCLTPRDRFRWRGRCAWRRGFRVAPAGRWRGRSWGRRRGPARGATPACACRR